MAKSGKENKTGKAVRPEKSVKGKSKPASLPVTPRRSPAGDVAAERLAVLFKALADPTRLHIIHLLRNAAASDNIEKIADVRQGVSLETGSEKNYEPGEVTIGDICRYVTGDKAFTSTVSHHLKELKNAGLLSIRRDGKHKLCRLNPERLSELAAYLCGQTGGS